ncbi:MAG: aminotransferase class V-fold PLP-dependent enzyme [Gemmatimonadota bacterium]|nr:MAG: aminotransferase class V-fold PLP-dependent enzyme [Gemmatimonadota bacterium]
MTHKSGRHFLQIPGPSNTPDRVLRAMAKPTIDHRGPEFAQLTLSILERLKPVFQTSGPVLMFPASGTGSWEASLVNTLSPGDRVLAFETGQFATAWRNVAVKLGIEVDWVEGDWRHGVDPAVVEAKLAEDKHRSLMAVLVVHNETSTGITSRVPQIRMAIDKVGHPALLMVDAISSLGSIDYRHDEWGVDVTICASQKGLMLPPGIGINAVSAKALKISQSSGFAKSYWDWGPVIKMNEKGFFPYTPPTNLLYGMDVALDMLLQEGLPNVFARHHRLAEATRTAVGAWGLELCGVNPAEYSDTLTAVMTPEGHDADELRRIILDRFDMSLGTGLGKVKGKLFRIGHLGDLNDLTLAGTLCGVEMGLGLAGIPHTKGGVDAALEYLASNS